MKQWGIYLVIAASMFAAACDDDDDNGNNNDMIAEADKSFTEMAALSNRAEIELGGIAATRGSNDLVREFGQHMVDEHTGAQDELEDIADDYDNIDWPDGLDQKHQQIRDQLLNLSGYSFDSLYIASQVMDHEKADSLFQAGMQSTNTRIQSYATKYHPHIEMHLVKADSIHNVIIENNVDDGN